MISSEFFVRGCNTKTSLVEKLDNTNIRNYIAFCNGIALMSRFFFESLMNSYNKTSSQKAIETHDPKEHNSCRAYDPEIWFSVKRRSFMKANLALHIAIRKISYSGKVLGKQTKVLREEEFLILFKLRNEEWKPFEIIETSNLS